MRTTNNPVQTVAALNAIVRLQSDVIDELFILLMQHIGAEEADQLPVLRKINEAAKLRNEIPGAEVYDPVPVYIR